MAELLIRFERVFKKINYNKNKVCELFKHLQDLTLSHSSNLNNKLKDSVSVLCEYESIIVRELNLPRSYRNPEKESKFYKTAYTLMTEAIENLQRERYWSFRYQMYELSLLCCKDRSNHNP